MADSHRTPTHSAPPLDLPPAGFAEVSRAVVSVAADLVTGVQRAVAGNVRTARDNAWDAMLADQARNQARADLTREVAQLVRRPTKVNTF
jgi:F0F1-type ATP synthase epsilon subunit